MKYCCASFERLVENAGQKGVGVVHAVYLGERKFMLQFRPFDNDVYDFYSKIDPVSGKNSWPVFRNEKGDVRGINLITHQILKHCPLCGKSLKSLIDLQVAEFEDLVMKQKRLLSG